MDRDRERERERLHQRERDLMQYDLNSDELLDERNYPGDYPPPQQSQRGAASSSHHGHLTRGGRLVVDDLDLMHERDDPRFSAGAAAVGGVGVGGGAGRYPSTSTRIDPRDMPTSAPTQRRGAPVVDRDEYSPHRGGGSSRRALNAM